MKAHGFWVAKAIFLASLGLAGTAAQAQAAKSPQNAIYGELGWSSITFKDSGYSFKPSAVRALIGTEINPNLAFEGMVGLGVADDTIRIANTPVTAEIDKTWGLYLKPKVSLANNVEVFARLGYARTHVSVSAPGYRAADTGGDLSYGAGASVKLTDSISVNADYMSYYNKDGVKGTGFTVGLGFKF
jgi:opacity protein-like surface antigen